MVRIPPSLLAGPPVIAITGAYGSGKTEVSVNLALALAETGRRVQIADLDLVNPYFRCREARDLMEAQGIRVVAPEGRAAFADLPIVLPEIRGLLHPPEGTTTILDVGGDDTGARALAAFRPVLQEGEYRMLLVLNARRPFTTTVAGATTALRDVECGSRLRVTGLLANTHLLDDTTTDDVLDGWRLARALEDETGRPLQAVAVRRHLATDPALAVLDVPVLALDRRMLPPWLAPATVTAAPPRDGFARAAALAPHGGTHGAHRD